MRLNRRGALQLLGTAGACAAALQEAGGQAPAPPVPAVNPSRNHAIAGDGGVHGRKTGAKAAVAALCAEGTRCVFGVPGAQNNEFWDALKSHGVPYLLVANEFSASIMADATARVTGQPGVFAVVPGPGLTNALTGIGEALHDSVPIVGIVTDILRGPGFKVGQVHGLANSAILRPVCKAVIEVVHQGQIPGAIHEAHRIARCGEPGPVCVVVPYNLFSETWDYDAPVPLQIALPFDESGYRRAARVLADRRLRVGIYAGQGCFNSTASLQQLAETLQAPVATSVSGKGAISDRHPLAVGWGYGPYGTVAAERTFKEVDVVLALGVRYSEVSTAGYSIPRNHKIIHVDANQHNLGRNVPTCVSVCADAGLVIDRLLQEGDAIRRPACPPLWSAIRQRRDADRCNYIQAQVTSAVDPMVFLAELRRQLCEHALVFVDVTAATHWAAEAMDVPGPRHYFAPTNNQSMGWAIPAAIGAQRLDPTRQVASIAGDGCFLMSGLEITTAARSLLPVKFFILDDGSYHYMQMLQLPTFRRTTATEIARMDYAALAHGMGVAYNCIGANGDLRGGIARALATPGPVLTRVVISYDGREIRWLSALKATYIDHLSTGQKVRMASRVGARSLNPRPDSD